jgi:hypothetical protein
MELGVFACLRLFPPQIECDQLSFMATAKEAPIGKHGMSPTSAMQDLCTCQFCVPFGGGSSNYQFASPGEDNKFAIGGDQASFIYSAQPPSFLACPQFNTF